MRVKQGHSSELPGQNKPSSQQSDAAIQEGALQEIRDVLKNDLRSRASLLETVEDAIARHVDGPTESSAEHIEKMKDILINSRDLSSARNSGHYSSLINAISDIMASSKDEIPGYGMPSGERDSAVSAWVENYSASRLRLLEILSDKALDENNSPEDTLWIVVKALQEIERNRSIGVSKETLSKFNEFHLFFSDLNEDLEISLGLRQKEGAILEEIGLKSVQIRKEGNCFFEAVELALGLDSSLREALVSDMHENQKVYDDLLKGTGFDSHKLEDFLISNGVWNVDIADVAFGIVLGRIPSLFRENIVLVNTRDNTATTFETDDLSYIEKSDPKYVVYNGRDHYDYAVRA
ncbi:MAG: hypothetical protein ACI9BD_000755 [Candidatus Marinamargulisbacteria bacterium]|jgi:hypothetical protein